MLATRILKSGLSPGGKTHDAYVNHYISHFKNVKHQTELERGLNLVFADDWVPSIPLVTEALLASRRLNCFATANRILVALEHKIDNQKSWLLHLKDLDPIVKQLGLVTEKEMGSFEVVRCKSRWWY